MTNYYSGGLVGRYRAFRRRFKEGAVGLTCLNMTTEFPVYTPSGAGNYNTRSKLTKLAINHSAEIMKDVAIEFGRTVHGVIDVEEFAPSDEQKQISFAIKEHLDRYGSDKGHPNKYHLVYGRIFSDIGSVKNLFEIGLGTNNTDVFSHMGRKGKPGASLRAFRDYLREAQIFGADVDRRILFSEDRIETFFVDQTDRNTLETVGEMLPPELDVLIDDGLHAVNGNLASLVLGLRKVRVGGWTVIEDITVEARPIWETVSRLLNEHFESYLIRTPNAFVFAVKRLS